MMNKPKVSLVVAVFAGDHNEHDPQNTRGMPSKAGQANDKPRQQEKSVRKEKRRRGRKWRKSETETTPDRPHADEDKKS